MPPPLPSRYRLEVRLGRDQDIEEWLATDEHLDRPVLIRLLGPDANAKRRAEFLAMVRAAAAVRHPNLEPIFEAEEVEEGAYFVCEWNGGMTLQSRLEAGETLDYAEFAENAAGLAGALAALHRAGLTHAAIEPSSVLYTVSRPARLGGFGRSRRYLPTPAGDVTDLATVLEQALTGFAPGGPPPSEVVDGVPVELDRILARARRGELDANSLSHALDAIPRPVPPADAPARNLRVLILAGILLLIAAGLIWLGRFLSGSSGLPVIPQSQATVPAPTVATTTTTVVVAGADPPPAIAGAIAYDPFGEGGENDTNVGQAIDGNPETVWRTERYHDPMELLKPGVGLVVMTTGTPTTMQITGLQAGATFSIRWADTVAATPDEFETILSGATEGGPVRLQLPPRQSGNWLVWFTSLPRQGDGAYWVTIGEITFGQ
jgi:putative peptidoglycan lipid II flippase